MALFGKKKDKSVFLAPESDEKEKSDISLDSKDAVEDVKKRDKKKKKANVFRKGLNFDDYSHLKALRPKEKYVFHSDYFEIDDGYATILSFFHRDGGQDSFPPFWGVDRINVPLEADVTAVFLEQVSRMSESWIGDRQKTSETVANVSGGNIRTGGNRKERVKMNRKDEDLETIANELINGASYLNVHDRVLLKAPDIDMLDRAVYALESTYSDRFKTLEVDSYPGSQKEELTNLFKPNMTKRGKGFYFTSTEYAGSYHLVTQGLSDLNGEYVGDLEGDVNTSAVLFDINGYEKRVVVASDYEAKRYGKNKVSDVWGSKISQEALKNNDKVAHIVLNDVDLNTLGPRFDGITTYVDMNQGDVNMFEVFGSLEDELSLFEVQQRKIALMVDQIFAGEVNKLTYENELSKILTRFYIDMGMWKENAKKFQEDLRLVGIPHDQVPRLQDFSLYVSDLYDQVSRLKGSSEVTDAIYKLDGVFQKMLTANGDLFNTFTSDKIDKALVSPRVVYDFSRLSLRSKGVAMAQLVNIIAFACSNLEDGDSLIIHGADKISDKIFSYINDQFQFLLERGGRVVFLYNSLDKMFETKDFNKFEYADYTIFGGFKKSTMETYKELMNENFSLAFMGKLLTKEAYVNYIKRGYDNVIFRMDLSLGVSKTFKEKRMSLFSNS